MRKLSKLVSYLKTCNKKIRIPKPMSEVEEIDPEEIQKHLNPLGTLEPSKENIEKIENNEMEEEFGYKVKGPEPTRYGDWERKGRCTDF